MLKGLAFGVVAGLVILLALKLFYHYGFNRLLISAGILSNSIVLIFINMTSFYSVLPDIGWVTWYLKLSALYVVEPAIAMTIVFLIVSMGFRPEKRKPVNGNDTD